MGIFDERQNNVGVVAQVFGCTTKVIVLAKTVELCTTIKSYRKTLQATENSV